MFTVVDMYNAVLLELRRQKTTSITPGEFNYYCRKAHYEYITNRYADFEKHQKVTDDLQKIVVTFDGVNGNPAPLVPVGASNTWVIGKETFDIPPIAVVNTMKEKMFLLDVQFGFQCGTSDGVGSIIKYHNARIKHHDEKRIANVYRQPSDDRGQFYYTQTRNQIRRFGGGKLLVVSCIPTIIREPVIPELKLDGTSLYDPELDSRVNHEIVRFIVRDYLEVIMSERQNTYDNNTSRNFNQPTLNVK